MALTAKGTSFAEACNFGAPWQTAKTKVLLWGESHAEHMAPIIEAAIEGKDISVSISYKCAPAVGDPYKFILTEIPTYSKDCAAFKENVLTFLDENKGVSYVIMAGFWSSVIGHIFTDEIPAGNNATGAKLVHQSLSEIITRASAPNRRIVLVGDVPLFLGVRPTLCNMQEPILILRRPCEGQSKGESLDTFSAQQGIVVDVFNSLRSESTIVLAVGPAMCASGECITHLNGEFLYRDVHHLRRNLSHKTKHDLAALFGFEGLFNQPPIQAAR